MSSYNPFDLEAIKRHYTTIDWNDPAVQKELKKAKTTFSIFADYRKDLLSDSLCLLKRDGVLSQEAYDRLTKHIGGICESLLTAHAIALLLNSAQQKHPLVSVQ